MLKITPERLFRSIATLRVGFGVYPTGREGKCRWLLAWSSGPDNDFGFDGLRVTSHRPRQGHGRDIQCTASEPPKQQPNCPPPERRMQFQCTARILPALQSKLNDRILDNIYRYRVHSLCAALMAPGFHNPRHWPQAVATPINPALRLGIWSRPSPESPQTASVPSNLNPMLKEPSVAMATNPALGAGTLVRTLPHSTIDPSVFKPMLVPPPAAMAVKPVLGSGTSHSPL